MENELYDDNDDNYRLCYSGYAEIYTQDVVEYFNDVINDAFDEEPEVYWNID